MAAHNRTPMRRRGAKGIIPICERRCVRHNIIPKRWWVQSSREKPRRAKSKRVWQVWLWASLSVFVVMSVFVFVPVHTCHGHRCVSPARGHRFSTSDVGRPFEVVGFVHGGLNPGCSRFSVVGFAVGRSHTAILALRSLAACVSGRRLGPNRSSPCPRPSRCACGACARRRAPLPLAQ